MHLTEDRKKRPAEKLIELLYREQHIGFHTNRFATAGTENTDTRVPDDESKVKDADMGEDTAMEQNGERPDVDCVPGQTERGTIGQVTKGEPDDDNSSSSSDGDSDDEGRGNRHNDAMREVVTHGRIDSPRASVESKARTKHNDDRGRGVTNILMEYKWQPTFGGL